MMISYYFSLLFEYYTFSFSGLDANSFKLILDFMYLNKIKVTEQNVQFLLPAASLLQIMPIVEACAEFLKDKLQPSNCLGRIRVSIVVVVVQGDSKKWCPKCN